MGEESRAGVFFVASRKGTGRPVLVEPFVVFVGFFCASRYQGLRPASPGFSCNPLAQPKKRRST